MLLHGKGRCHSDKTAAYRLGREDFYQLHTKYKADIQNKMNSKNSIASNKVIPIVSRSFSKEELQMSLTLLKVCLTFLATMESQIKPLGHFVLHQSEWLG